MTSARGEAAPRREKGGDDITWVYTNLTGPKNEKKIHTVDSVSINGRWIFKERWVNLITISGTTYHGLGVK
jgi:hypothetical protein